MNRRDALRAIGLAAGLAPLSKLRALGGAHPSHPLGLQLYTVRDMAARDLEGTLKAISKIGYTQVETHSLYGRTPQAFRAALDAAQLTAPSAHYSYSAFADSDALAKAMNDSEVVGSRVLTAAWVDEKDRKTIDDWKRVADTLNTAGFRARMRQMRIAYHNYDYEFIPIDGKLPYDVLLQELDPDMVVMEMDLFWATKHGHDPVAYFKRYPQRFRMLHLKDRGKDGSQVDVGSGTIDFKSIATWKAQAGFGLYFVESDDAKDPLGFAKRSYEALSKIEL